MKSFQKIYAGCDLFKRFEEHRAKLSAPAMLSMKAGDTVKIYIYDVIGTDPFFGGVSAKDVVAEITKAEQSKSDIELHINSPGGDVFDALSIYNSLVRSKARKTVMVDGLDASAATVITMAGDRIIMAPQSEMMIHEARGGSFGTADDLKSLADRLATANQSITDIYQHRTEQSPEKLRELMMAETFMTADQAVELGFADEIEKQPEPRVKNEIEEKITASAEPPKPKARSLYELMRLSGR